MADATSPGYEVGHGRSRAHGDPATFHHRRDGRSGIRGGSVVSWTLRETLVWLAAGSFSGGIVGIALGLLFGVGDGFLLFSIFIWGSVGIVSGGAGTSLASITTRTLTRKPHATSIAIAISAIVALLSSSAVAFILLLTASAVNPVLTALLFGAAAAAPTLSMRRRRLTQGTLTFP